MSRGHSFKHAFHRDAPAFALIEPYANTGGGHWNAALLTLARAVHTGAGQCIAVCLGGVTDAARADLKAVGVKIIDRSRRSDLGTCVLVCGSKVCAALSSGTQKLFPRRRFPHQVTLISRCLLEAASLRIAKKYVGKSPIIAVIMTASEGLHGLAAALSGVPHIRIVHEVFTTEDRIVKVIGRLGRSAESNVVVVTPTPGVHRQFRAHFPDVRAVVKPFALVGERDRISALDRDFVHKTKLGSEVRTVAIVGGWWWHKDLDTIEAALTRMNCRLHLVIAGRPLDSLRLERISKVERVRTDVRERELSDREIREIYAECDFTLVSRLSGTNKESGLVMDAVRYGVPLVVSNHDSELTSQLACQPWAYIFQAGDPASLAKTLDRAALVPPALPPASAARSLGLMTGQEAVKVFTALQRGLGRER